MYQTGIQEIKVFLEVWAAEATRWGQIAKNQKIGLPTETINSETLKNYKRTPKIYPTEASWRLI